MKPTESPQSVFPGIMPMMQNPFSFSPFMPQPSENQYNTTPVKEKTILKQEPVQSPVPTEYTPAQPNTINIQEKSLDNFTKDRQRDSNTSSFAGHSRSTTNMSEEEDSLLLNPIDHSFVSTKEETMEENFKNLPANMTFSAQPSPESYSEPLESSWKGWEVTEPKNSKKHELEHSEISNSPTQSKRPCVSPTTPHQPAKEIEEVVFYEASCFFYKKKIFFVNLLKLFIME
jgi:hypothetical protein